MQFYFRIFCFLHAFLPNDQNLKFSTDLYTCTLSGNSTKCYLYLYIIYLSLKYPQFNSKRKFLSQKISSKVLINTSVTKVKSIVFFIWLRSSFILSKSSCCHFHFKNPGLLKHYEFNSIHLKVSIVIRYMVYMQRSWGFKVQNTDISQVCLLQLLS